MVQFLTRLCIILLFVVCSNYSVLARPIHIGEKLNYFARTTHKNLNEVSGIIRGVRYPEVFWVHNDSGDKARIFAINIEGEVVFPEWLKGKKDGSSFDEQQNRYKGLPIHGASNYDWEDITMLDDMIILSDTGNNGNARRDLAVYVIKEPNPYAVEATHILKRIPIAYPDQKHYPPKEGSWKYDCEAIFTSDRKLYFLSKERVLNQLNNPIPRTTLYRLDTMHNERTNLLTKVDELDGLGGWVTAASVSPDGQYLAILCESPAQSVWIFKKPEQGDKWLSSEARMVLFHDAGQCEALTWENNENILIMNEDGDMYRLTKDVFIDMMRNPRQ